MYRRKNIVIIAMCVAILLMIVGYAAFSTSLKINGTGKITSVWDIYFESVKLSSTSGTASEASNPTISNTSISFNINLRKPGDKVVYKAVLKNAGTVDAIVSEINAEAKGTAAIINTVTGIEKGDTVSAGSTKTITITVKYDSTITTIPSITTNELTISIECVQADQSITNEDLVVYHPMLKVGSTSSGTTVAFLDGPITRESIETITFTNSKTVPSGVIDSWDVSAAGDGKVMAWYTDSDGDSLYEVVIGQDGGVIANPDSSHLFQDCQKLTAIDFSYFDTSKVTRMTGMFGRCYLLMTADVSNFSTGKVTTFNSAFSGCRSLVSVDVSNWDTSSATSMGWMFQDLRTITSIDVSKFDTSNVTNMEAMFLNCIALKELNVSHFDTSRVKNMYAMFGHCIVLERLNLNNFDTSNVTDMSYMFIECRELVELKIDNFDTSNVKNMEYMFKNCVSFTSLDLSHFDTSEVTNMEGMFSMNVYNKLVSLDISSFDTSEVKNMSYMFQYNKIADLDLKHFDTSKVTDMSYMFSYVDIVRLDISSFVTSSVTNMTSMFTGGAYLMNIDMRSATFDHSPTTTNMFYEVAQINKFVITVNSASESFITSQLSTDGITNYTVTVV